MSKSKKSNKEYCPEVVEVLEAFRSYRQSVVQLDKLKLKQKALLSNLTRDKQNQKEFDSLLDKAYAGQEREITRQKGEVQKAFSEWKEKQKKVRPGLAKPYKHKEYKDSKYKVGSYMLLRPDQVDDSEEDISHCGVGSPKLFWKLGWYYLHDDNILANPPEIGVHFTHVPYPLGVNQQMPIPTNERPWLETYYSIDGPIADVYEMGAQGANGGAHFTIAYGIDIGDSGPCGIEFFASSEVTGIVDVGGYSTSDHVFPHIDFSLNIDVYQYRCLGAPISEVNLHDEIAYKSWHALQPTEWDTWGGDDSIRLTEPGLYTMEQFKAEINREISDVNAGDSFLFVYSGSVFASESGVQLSHNNVGTWIVRVPIMNIHFYPGVPDYDMVKVIPPT